MPTIAFAWVGCKLNRYEIQVMSDALRPYGFEPVPFARQADCYVVNTCSVTSDADISSRQTYPSRPSTIPRGQDYRHWLLCPIAA